MLTADRLRARMVAELVRCGDLPEDWRSTFEAVPRHEFIPEVIWRLDHDRNGLLVPLRREQEPKAWLRRAYLDAPVYTQIEDGDPAQDGTGWELSSSATAPGLVADMLATLDVQPGTRVLEIGTGTGWNAALLAHRVGPENVTSIEVDAAVAEHARERLDAAGYGKVTVITGDGAAGWPDAAPYDRVIATVGVHEIPHPWVEQATGVVLAPINRTYHSPGIGRLVVGPDGTASGRLLGPAAFMGLRAQRVRRPRGSRIVTGAADSTTWTEVHPHRVAGDRSAAVAIGLRVDGCHKHWADGTTTGTGALWLLDAATGSWASVSVTAPVGPPYRVEQAGPRRLWDEVAAAYRWWRDAGEPSVGEWLVTVGPEGQRVTLDGQ